MNRPRNTAFWNGTVFRVALIDIGLILAIVQLGHGLARSVLGVKGLLLLAVGALVLADVVRRLVNQMAGKFSPFNWKYYCLHKAIVFGIGTLVAIATMCFCIYRMTVTIEAFRGMAWSFWSAASYILATTTMVQGLATCN